MASFQRGFAQAPGRQPVVLGLGRELALQSARRTWRHSVRARAGSMAIPYRDDNRYCWASDEFDFLARGRICGRHPKQVRKYVSLLEMVNELDIELAGDDAQEIWVLGHSVSWIRRGKPSTNWKARSRSASPIITRNGITRSAATPGLGHGAGETPRRRATRRTSTAFLPRTSPVASRACATSSTPCSRKG